MQRVRRHLRYALPTLAAIGSASALEVLRRRFERGQLFRPQRTPEGVEKAGGRPRGAVEVTFPSEEGARLHGWWMELPRARGAVLFCHGNSGNIGHWVELFPILRRLRLSVLAFDYQGYGMSEGRPSEAGLFGDARSAYVHLVSALRQHPGRVILAGHSLGGAVAIDAALHCSVAGLIIQSSFTDLHDMARVKFPKLPLHLVTRNRFRSIDKIARVTVPKLFVHGRRDDTVPIRFGQRLFAAATGDKRFLAIPRAGHNDLHRIGGLRYQAELARFRDHCLPRRRRVERGIAQLVASPTSS